MGRRPWGRPKTRWRDYTVYLVWPGNSLGSPRKSWKTLLGRGTSGLPCSACCHHNRSLDNRTTMDGWMDGQHCASALVRFRHKNRLLRVRKWTGFGVKYLFLSTQTRLLNALMKNIQWFVTFKSCNTVLNCGHWLGSLPPSSASPPHMKGYKQVMWTWYDVFCITVNMMLYVTYDTYRCEQISDLSRGLLLLLLLF